MKSACISSRDLKLCCIKNFCTSINSSTAISGNVKSMRLILKRVLKINTASSVSTPFLGSSFTSSATCTGVDSVGSAPYLALTWCWRKRSSVVRSAFNSLWKLDCLLSLVCCSEVTWPPDDFLVEIWAHSSSLLALTRQRLYNYLTKPCSISSGSWLLLAIRDSNVYCILLIS